MLSFRILVILLACGAGIFALYSLTRDELDWGRLMRRGIATLAIVVAGVWGWVYWSSLPPTTPVSEMWGVALGASASDVLFLKGEPDEISEAGTWVYSVSPSRRYELVFGDENEVVRVLIFPGPGYSSGVSLLGVREGFDVTRVAERLGEPTRIVNLPGDLRRAYLYEHLNALFILERGAVMSFGIYDLRTGDSFAEGASAEAGS